MTTTDGSASSIPEEKRSVIELVEQEATRQMNSHSRTASAVDTRAALLVSTAILFVALPKNGSSTGCAYTVAVIFALIGACMGVIALFTKRRGEEIDLQKIESEIWPLEALEAIRAITRAKQKILDDDRKRLKLRHRVVAWGFTFLALSLTSTVTHVLLGV